jgi:hypothetical protein
MLTATTPAVESGFDSSPRTKIVPASMSTSHSGITSLGAVISDHFSRTPFRGRDRFWMVRKAEN